MGSVCVATAAAAFATRLRRNTFSVEIYLEIKENLFFSFQCRS
jgi:hypothetical protein